MDDNNNRSEVQSRNHEQRIEMKLGCFRKDCMFTAQPQVKKPLHAWLRSLSFSAALQFALPTHHTVRQEE